MTSKAVDITSISKSEGTRSQVDNIINNVNTIATDPRITLTETLPTEAFNAVLRQSTNGTYVSSYAEVTFNVTAAENFAKSNIQLLAGAVVAAIIGCLVIACCCHMYQKWASRPPSFGQERFTDMDAGFGKALHVQSRGWEF
jgi:hypothetical protein